MASRTYHQRARAEQAAHTRAEIIEAVFTCLRESPAEPITVDRIAAIAGVARSTVYAIFGSRRGLFDAVGRELADRSGYAQLLEAKHEPDARSHLRAGMRAGMEMFAANRDIYRALRSMAQLDPDAVGDVVAQMDAERARGMRRLVRRLADEAALREGLSVRDAEQVLFMLTSFETFDTLYTGRKLSTTKTVALLTEVAERAVLS
jgi:AcrR family transcriptional regulator